MDTPSCTIPLEAEPLDCCVSPAGDLLAAALVTGKLQLASFACPPSTQNGGGAQSSQLAYQLQLTIPAPQASSDHQPQPSKKKQKKAAAAAAAGAADAGAGGGGGAAAAEPPSCRACCFTSGGGAVLAGYADHVVRSYDVATGRLTAVFSGEHDAQLSRVFACGGTAAPHLFASGDEEGLVALWDTRVPAGGGGGAVSRYTQHTDYITDFALNGRAQALVVTSGDATLSVLDLRKNGKALARSEDDNDDELLSCAVLKGGRKVVTGTQSGVLHLYSWGYFNDCSDRFPGHPESVQALVAFDEDTLLTGSSDGGVRVVGVLPNRLLGILGQHNGDFPVERLALSSDRRVLASTSHDAAVKLWDLAVLHDDEGDDDEEGGGEDGGEGEEEDGGGGGGGDLASAAAAAATAAAGRRRFGDEDEDVAERAKRRALRGQEPEEGMEGEDEDGSEDEDEDLDEDEDENEGEGEEGESEGDGSGSEGEAADGAGRSGSGEGEEGKVGVKARGGGGGGGKEAQVQGAAAAAARGGGTGAAKAAAAAGGGADSDDGGGDDSEDDSEEDGGGGKKRRKAPKREKTRWTQGAEQKKGGAANFFADLL
ncbi:hypothetical protein PLESTB_001033100 [Pleodorina starrii]|uniref:Uncharacterized protein n=1 Tax=Pleodorina starrii TaxID=330485 RepID=A0A9W6BP24_9CHLO|nr:hypothetical protein PLESTM_001824900 [Pleodorina starrii]GLC55826.1 hypothetical protein PLESTB_001033100 [Pleodorina starrii]GLC63812.1 hypothetical protein PLESTF_000085700 [Pleodorina starrii]